MPVKGKNRKTAIIVIISAEEDGINQEFDIQYLKNSYRGGLVLEPPFIPEF